jgi:hypothetical protein
MYSVDKPSQTIRFSTTRAIEAGEELCIFYAHKLWFEDKSQPTRTRSRRVTGKENDEDAVDIFGGLSKIDVEKDQLDMTVEEEDLPFEECRYMDSDEEDLDDIPTCAQAPRFVMPQLTNDSSGCMGCRRPRSKKYHSPLRVSCFLFRSDLYSLFGQLCSQTRTRYSRSLPSKTNTKALKFLACTTTSQTRSSGFRRPNPTRPALAAGGT